MKYVPTCSVSSLTWDGVDAGVGVLSEGGEGVVTATLAALLRRRQASPRQTELGSAAACRARPAVTRTPQAHQLQDSGSGTQWISSSSDSACTLKPCTHSHGNVQHAAVSRSLWQPVASL